MKFQLHLINRSTKFERFKRGDYPHKTITPIKGINSSLINGFQVNVLKNYRVYDHENVTRCQAPWGDAKFAQKN